MRDEAGRVVGSGPAQGLPADRLDGPDDAWTYGRGSAKCGYPFDGFTVDLSRCTLVCLLMYLVLVCSLPNVTLVAVVSDTFVSCTGIFNITYEDDEEQCIR